MEELHSLGRKTNYPTDYAPEVLECFQNKHPENDYWVKFNCPEFTSLCPITGQPDFATIYISYVPDEKMVESKSLNTSLGLAMDYEFEIHTPLMWLNKEQTWELADQLGVLELIRTRTLTCYNGIVANGCGECPACKLRAEGLKGYLDKKKLMTLNK